jgi:hypothetical protein
MKIEVMKLTTKDGRKYYNADHSPALIAATLKHCPNWKTVELIEMTEEEYFAIPATNDSAALFEMIAAE